jgi:hypothetical protein
VQCGSPSLKNRKLCHFHQRWQQGRIQLNANHARRSRYSLDLPILEDANSIQVALMQGMRLLLTNQVDHRTAALLFYALQTASSNLSRTTFEPRPQQVVIDPSSIADTSLGDDAWYKEEFTNDEDEQEAETKDQPAAASAARVDIHAMADCARVEPAPQLLGGAAVHRCGKSTVLNKALAAEAISIHSKWCRLHSFAKNAIGWAAGQTSLVSPLAVPSETWTTRPSARHNGVFWFEHKEQMNGYFHVGGRRSLKKIGSDEPM